MNATEIREVLDREPFEPMRIRLSSGDAYELYNPDLVVVMRSRLFVAAPNSDKWALIPFLHIAAIENLTDGSHPKRRRRKPRG